MSFTFLYPALLLGLLALPLIYLLLRVTPPPAKRIILPSVRFLSGLEQKTPPVEKTPWWIILLRMAILACLITGLARPVFNPQSPLQGQGPITLVLDNSWASAQNWTEQQEVAINIVRQAAQNGRPVTLILPAPQAGEDKPQFFPAESPDLVVSRIKGLAPSSWPSRLSEAAALIPVDSSVYWITSGLAESGFESMTSRAALQAYLPQSSRWPLLLRSPGSDAASLARVEAPSGAQTAEVQIRALDRKGQIVDQVSARVTGGEGYTDAISRLPATELEKIQSVTLLSRSGPGAVFIKDRASRNNRIGMISTEAGQKNYNLAMPAYYISRAVEPFASFSTGSVEDILNLDPGMIVMAENTALAPKVLEDLSAWIEKGGIVLRFATSALAETPDSLTPVPLRRSERSLQGNLTWDNPLSIQSIAPASPLTGLSMPKDVKIHRQLLAQSVPELTERSWVTLSDGTPLVTGKYEGKGLLVLVHTTATPDWSDLPLSGFYVDIFRTLSELADRPDKREAEDKLLHPLLLLDGFGQLMQPPATLKPVEQKDFSTLTPSSLYPPGLYGTANYSLALNLGDRLPPLEPLAPHLKPAQILSAGSESEFDAGPALLALALFLFIADTVMTLIFSGLIYRMRKLLPVLAVLLSLADQAMAADVDLASKIHLAYIRTGDLAIDRASQDGLDALTSDLATRTAITPGPAIGITPGVDALIFYPLIYWPVAVGQPDLSPTASAAVQSYLDRGGMLLIDSRDGGFDPSSLAPSAQVTRLRGLLENISFSPLVQAPDDHVLYRSFYLLNARPETAMSGQLWIEEDALEETGAVSSVIMTGGDWGRAWASAPGAMPFQEKERATRFGINVVMYALTGNYKTDQIHMNAVLEKLGK